MLAEIQRLASRPVSAGQLTKKLQLGDVDPVIEMLTVLAKEGAVVQISDNRYVGPENSDLVTGILDSNPRGFAHVASEAPGVPDVFVAAEDRGTAMHGDRVVVRMQRAGKPRTGRGGAGDSRERGKVIEILDRANQELVGTFQQLRGRCYVVPDNPRLVNEVTVPSADVAGKPTLAGDKVVVRLVSWEPGEGGLRGELVEILGSAGDPGVDMESILRAHGIREPFPDTVIAESERVPTTVQEHEMATESGREDFRGYTIVTIDPDDARDFDDAIHVERIGDGWRMQVHIADVSHYVRPGMALDREARRRGNSVYLPDRVVPMLPTRLSNGICSLRPKENRLVYSAVVDFDAKGNQTGARFVRGIICSAARLTYKEAFQMLGAPPKGEIAELLHTAWEFASLLRRKRFAEGSLDLDFPEVKVWVNRQTGKADRIEKIENDISHQLIEEFMLAANEAVGGRVKNRSVPAIYRVHEDPDPEKLMEFRGVAQDHGYKMGDVTKREELCKFLKVIKGTREEYGLKTSFLKSLQRARYDTAPIGHFGLAKADYGHFTSPIRRYADLTLHRSLEVSEGRAKRSMPAGELAEIAAHISGTEREAELAEREAKKLKLLEYFLEESHRADAVTHEAVVLEARSYGLFIELPEAMMNGVVPVSLLEGDYFIFDPLRRRLVGRSGGVSYSAGDEILVKVAKVDMPRRQIDFAVVKRTGKKGLPEKHGTHEPSPDLGSSDRPAKADVKEDRRGGAGRGRRGGRGRGQGGGRVDAGSAGAKREPAGQTKQKQPGGSSQGNKPGTGAPAGSGKQARPEATEGKRRSDRRRRRR